MALMKPTFYIGMLAIVLFFFTGMALIGTDLAESDRIVLNNRSYDYINVVKGANTDSGFESIADTDSAESKTREILNSDDNSSVSDSNDFLSTLYIKKERASAPTNFFSTAYNIPSSILIGLGLPLENWRNYTNIISVILFISLLSMMWIKYINT